MQHDPFHVHLLLHSAALVEERLRQRLADLDIRPRQARILDALDRMGTASQADLARAFDLTPASMSTMTVRLLTAGYILRNPHPDEARSNVLELSDRGRSLLLDIRAAWRDVDRMIAERIGPERAAALAVLTRDLRDALGGRVPGQAEDGRRDDRMPSGEVSATPSPDSTLPRDGEDAGRPPT